jgi:hypothetical protein
MICIKGLWGPFSALELSCKDCVTTALPLDTIEILVALEGSQM